MIDPIAPTGAISALSATSGAQSSYPAFTPALEPVGAAPAADAAHFHAMVVAPEASTESVSSKLVDAGMNLSHRYAERMDAAHTLASISPDELGIDNTDYMRAMLQVQTSLNEVTVELQSTAQIANSVKDSFNGLYRMQG